MNAVNSLDDKYTAREGRIFLTGIQALVRLPLEQARHDRAAGLNTAGFITGYRGSPLGGYDQALWRARRHLEANDVRFEPGLNEDLAATALVGTQQIGLFGKPTRDGVFGLWFGKNPGLDRSGDAIRHANALGAHPRGGVLVVVGDDHAAKSSDLCNQCEPACMALRMPVLAPTDIQEVLTFGLFGWALSRYSGLWVAFKVLPHHMDCAASVVLGPAAKPFRTPEDFQAPPGGLNIQWPDDRFRQEERLINHRLPAAAAFARANGIDRIVLDSPHADLGIVAAGKVYQDLLQALDYLGLGDGRRHGLRLYKPGMVWPLEREGALGFASGLRDIIVVEEKEPILETQLRDLLYNEPAARRPRIVGKRDLDGAPLFPVLLELDPVAIARSLGRQLLRRGPDPEIEARMAALEQRLSAGPGPAGQPPRIPYFCAGCPHSRSLRTPEGSRAIGGIGCHWMATWTPELKTEPPLHMGGEGANWIGQAPFTETRHVFQNLGDGTYFHSGSLAIRAAVVAGVNVTYKILYNDAIAMTGGQPVEGGLTVEQIAQQLAAEGVRRIEVVSENPERFENGPLAALGVKVSARTELLRIEEELSACEGVTALIFDQTCAAEKRRRRKRGSAPTPSRRLYINSEVCEGCGDCGVQSNCVAVEPRETELGRKRVINQSVCNKDFSCSNGFCPSFVWVQPGVGAESQAIVAPEPVECPEPTRLDLIEPRGVVITGIGGTGVVTVGALLGMAAHLEGKGVSVLDSIGLAQKNGAVVSYVRIAERPEQIRAARIPVGEADVLLACDLVVGSEPEAISRLRRGRTRAVVNSHLTPTAQFVFEPDLTMDGKAVEARISEALEPDAASFIDAQALAEGLFGDAMASNLLMLGYAYQKGLLPLGAESILRAIELNGVSIEMNKKAFAWGRCAAIDPVAARAAARLPEAPPPATLDEVITRRAHRLIEYQGAGYAARYRALAERAAAAEAALPGETGERFARGVAEAYYKLLAYKDEYEVARLLTQKTFRREIDETFGRGARVSYLMSPPLLAPRDAAGRPRKIEFGGWLQPALWALARLRWLRGAPFDPFGWTEERRTERALITEYEQVIEELTDQLTPDRYELSCAVAEAPLKIRGYGHVKAASMRKVRPAMEAQLARLHAPGADLRGDKRE